MSDASPDSPGPLSNHEVSALSPELDRALQYLRSARNPQEGWGVIAGLPSDLHQTAIALDAIDLAGVADAKAIRSECAQYFYPILNEAAGSLTLDEHVDAVLVLQGADLPNDKWKRQFLKPMRNVYGEHLRTPPKVPTIIQDSRAMLVLASLGMQDTSEFQLGARRLVELQNSSGGWDDSGTEADLVGTSWAVRALSAAAGGRASESADRGSRYLSRRIALRGWDKTESVGDVYVLSSVLRALSDRAEEHEHFNILLDGLTMLKSLQKPDGGWAGGENSPTTVEHSAVATAALANAEGRKLVPARLAYLYINDLQNRVLEARSAAYDLRRSAQSGSMGDATEQRVQRAEQVARTTSRTTLWSAITAIIASIAAGIAALVSAGNVLSTSSGAIIAGTTALVVGFIAYVTRFFTRTRDKSEPTLPQVRQSAKASPLVDQFFDITIGVPSEVRQELAYLLYEEFLDVPPDVGARRGLSTGYRLGLAPPTAQRFSSWVSEAARLRKEDRRLVFEQIRKSQ